MSPRGTSDSAASSCPFSSQEPETKPFSSSPLSPAVRNSRENTVENRPNRRAFRDHRRDLGKAT